MIWFAVSSIKKLTSFYFLSCFTDIDTRQRAACDLVRGLCKFFEGTVIGIFSQYVGAMLQVG